MNDLREAMVKIFNQKMDDGSLHKIVEKNIDKFVHDITNDALSSWGDFSKELRKKIQDDLVVKIGEISFDQYNRVVIEAVKARVDTSYISIAKEKLNKEMDELFEKAPTEYKLSTLINSMKKGIEDQIIENNWQGKQMSLHIEDYTSLVFIRFDLEPNKERYQCEYSLVVNKEQNRLIDASIDKYSRNKSILKRSFLNDSSLHGHEKQLFHMMTQDTKFIIDEDDCDLYYSEEY